MAATERTLDCTIQALGSLLFVLHNEFADNLKQLDQSDTPPSQ